MSLIEHALGLDHSAVSYRNYFVAGPGHHDRVVCEELEAAGMMARYRHRTSGGDIFVVTDAGVAALSEAEGVGRRSLDEELGRRDVHGAEIAEVPS